MNGFDAERICEEMSGNTMDNIVFRAQRDEMYEFWKSVMNIGPGKTTKED